MEYKSLREFLENDSYCVYGDYPLIGLWVNNLDSDNPKKDLIRILPYPERLEDVYYANLFNILTLGCNFSNFLDNKFINYWKSPNDNRIDILIDPNIFVNNEPTKEITNNEFIKKELKLNDKLKCIFSKKKYHFRKEKRINYNSRDGKNKEEISLREFVYRFVGPNTLVRVWYQNTDSSYTLLPACECPTKKYITMEHGIEWGNSYKKYLNKRFVKVTDIRCEDYPEAINIVIDLNTDIL